MSAQAAARLHDRLDRLAEISATSGDRGVTREAYTGLYEQAVNLAEGWMLAAGMQTRRDAAGNLFGRIEGSDSEAACVLTGSHLDSTLEAGRLDGAYGVLGALEAAERLAGTTRRSLEVVAITAEEPRFSTGCLGSRALVGDLSPGDAERLCDRDGVTLAGAMRALRMDPAALPGARLPDGYAAAFVELHIEQGAVLEHERCAIGIVEAIAAPHDLSLTIAGEAAHAGTTPMGLRRDALLGAAEIALAVEAAAAGGATGRTVGTTGVLRVSPGANNVIPGLVEMEVDVRDTDVEQRDAVVDSLLARAATVCARRGLDLGVQTVARDVPVRCATAVTDATAAECAELGVPGHRMVSGAYHDALILARTMPVGMIFVPSIGGVSHHPDERTDPGDLDLGVDILTGTLRRLAEAA